MILIFVGLTISLSVCTEMPSVVKLINHSELGRALGILNST